MSNKVSHTGIGLFVLGAIAILIGSIWFFTGGNPFKTRSVAVMYYDRSIQGLELGAALKLRGVKIGEVIKIQSYFNEDAMSVINAVYVSFTEEQVINKTGRQGLDLIEELIDDHGLRAQLRVQSYLTGLLYIEIDFFSTETVLRRWGHDQHVPEIPTSPTDIEKLSDMLNAIDFDKIISSMENIATNIEGFLTDPELQTLAANVNKTLASINELANHTDQRVLTKLDTTLSGINQLIAQINNDYPSMSEDLQASLATLQRSFANLEIAINSTGHLLSDDSPAVFEFTQTMQQFQRAAKAVTELAQSIEREPESLIRGKSKR